MLFSTFSSYLESIAETTLRNSITEQLAHLFQELSSNESEAACWLLLGRVYPAYEGIEFQFAEKMMIRSIAESYEQSSSDVLATFKKMGDMGQTARSYADTTGHTSSSLTVRNVFEELRSLAADVGEGSQERKVTRVSNLLKQLDPISAQFIVRIILTRLRLGFSDMTILDALSWAKTGSKEDRIVLEDAYQKKHNLGALAAVYLQHGKESLDAFDIELGVPIQPALCQRLKTAQEMIDKMGKVFVEGKYDGTRVQIHIHTPSASQPWRVRTFTRSLEESSHMFPELSSMVEVFGSHELIFDCEAVGFDPATGKLLKFQETIQRKRKHDVDLFSSQIPLRFFVFDLIYLDGKSLLQEPLSKRKERLHALLSVPALQGKTSSFVESPYIVTKSADELRSFHKQQLESGLEGAVIKQFDSVYQPGRKGWSWVKFKEEETSAAKLSDTIDAVVLGYWYGKGKRTKFGMGAFLIGIQGKQEQICTLSKVGTGLSDDQWREMVARASTLISQEKPSSYLVPDQLKPDVWIDPKIIVEVAGDELTISKIHSAGKALRFPRLIQFRDDKSLADITTVEELESIS